MATTHRWGRPVGSGLTALSLTAAMTLAGPITAAAGAGLADLVCPAPGATQADQFDDDDGNTHEDSINCAAQYDLVGGYSDGTFRPGQPIDRAQMATLMVKFIETALDRPLTTDGVDDFSDDDSSVHEGNIEKLVDNGVVSGLGGGTFGPSAPVTRAQLATFLSSAMRLVTTLPASNTDAFVDDEGSVHEDNINALAAAGVVSGTSATTYSPGGLNTRGQQATQTMQAAGYAEQRNDWAPTASLELTVDQSSVAQGGTVTGQATGVGVTAVSVAGCGLSGQTLGDRSSTAGGVQFAFDVPANQATGSCDLTFTVAIDGAGSQQVTRTINVTDGTTGGGGSTASGTTARPEATTFQILSTTAADGTKVKFTFDEPVTGAPTNPSKFRTYSPSGAVNPHGAASTALVESGGTTVIVTFPGIDSATKLQGLALLAIQNDAVFGNTATDGNTEAAFILNRTTGSTSAPAGITTAPDLTTISGISADTVNAGNTLATFSFDEAAFVVAPAGFHLIKKDGTPVTCTAVDGAAAPATTGSTTIKTTCATGTAINSTLVARGVIEAGTVSDANESADATPNAAPFLGTVNVEQASSSPDAPSDAPDLVSVAFDGKGTAQDEVVFTFDDLLFGAGTIANSDQFFLYDFNGNTISGIAAPAERNPSNHKQVLAKFADGALDQAVGAGVRAGAVQGATGGNLTNQLDEVGVANSKPGTTAGRTDGPDLTAVELLDSAGFGDVRTVVFRFDETVTTLGGAGSYVLYQPGGARLTASGADCTIGTAADSGTSSVRCPAAAFGSTPAALSSTVRGAVAEGAATDGSVPNPVGAFATKTIDV